VPFPTQNPLSMGPPPRLESDPEEGHKKQGNESSTSDLGSSEVISRERKVLSL
jgi:hypothetical protein